MAPMVAPRGLIFLCLLQLSVQANVNTAVLTKMIQYFNNNVQPKTKPDIQYAIAISVPEKQCTDETSSIETVFSREDAEKVQTILTNGQTCELCTNSQNVIAARPKSDKIHAEYVLLYPPGNSPMDKLLEKAKDNDCVVFYTYNSPCVTKCIDGERSILEGLSNWKNKRNQGLNVFVFHIVWHKDVWRSDLSEEFKKIDEKVPLYQCYGAERMNCFKCRVQQTTSYCLDVQDKKQSLNYFLDLIHSYPELVDFARQLLGNLNLTK
ncbi:uncharacterized protein [Paramisgurnus dabryanus]|uniref:uncharacterized protein n=1 Tax=Paramisgurnus dabryanus TaxID=90735 RepID=UPI0031F3D857